ncbi:hypothetical protein JCM24511_02142 [Saitozyma sp. JCM 24511]|nr:hypothetical protein JCM24511_02142 [Saitozyma sp. JCM 24511]
MSSNLNKVVIREADGPKGSPFLSNMIVSGDKVYLAGVIGVDNIGNVVQGGVAEEATEALKTAVKRLALVDLDLSDGEKSH